MDNIIIPFLVILLFNLLITEDNIKIATKALGNAILGIFAFVAAILLAIGTEMQDFSINARSYFEKRKNEDS